MIQLTDLSMQYGQKLLFYGVNLNLNHGVKYALVGANGSGKSTFLQLLNEVEEPTAGNINRAKDITLGWLKQDHFQYEHVPVREVVLLGREPLWRAIKRRDELLQLTDWTDEIGLEFSLLDEVIRTHDGYSADSEIDTILKGLGLAATSIDKPLGELSGGYKLRVLLAQVLFKNPDILLLDEPTNHLDIVSIRWLEQFLKQQFQGMVVFISHDVGFIDAISDWLLDVDYGEIRQYRAPYSHFLTEKALLEQQRLVERQSIEEKIASMQAFVDKFRAKASKAAQARSRMKMIDKLELPDVLKSSRIAPGIHFQQKLPSGKQVLKADHISKSFANKKLFDNFSLRIQRGEKVALLGANGAGKSTLLKLLLGAVTPDAGEFHWGHNVRLSYFSQDHHELIHQSETVLDWLQHQVEHVSETNARKMLGQMLFVQDDVHKNVLTLSGGESTRLLLAKMLLDKANVIILDEPTNHMDIETIDALAEALKEFSGTVLFVSHNSDFVSKIATRVLYFEAEQTIIDYNGCYEEFASDYFAT